MNRILFLLSKLPCREDMNAIISELTGAGYAADFTEIKMDYSLELYEDTLYVTDSFDILSKIRSQGSDALIYLHDESMLDGFPGARYFVINAAECDSDYFLKIYERIHELPWEMYRTGRLIVRETTESDVDVFYEMYKDPSMTAFMEPLYQDREAERKYVKEYREKVYSCQEFGIWTLIDRESGAIIGRGGLNFRSGYDNVEIGFAIAKEYRRRGYATEAVKSFIEFAKEKELGDINALVMPGNKASEEMLKKIGFEYMGNTVDGGLEYMVYCCKC